MIALRLFRSQASHSSMLGRPLSPPRTSPLGCEAHTTPDEADISTTTVKGKHPSLTGRPGEHLVCTSPRPATMWPGWWRASRDPAKGRREAGATRDYVSRSALTAAWKALAHSLLRAYFRCRRATYRPRRRWPPAPRWRHRWRRDFVRRAARTGRGSPRVRLRTALAGVSKLAP